MPWLYFPTLGIWLIWKDKPLVALDWIYGCPTVRFNLNSNVRRPR